MEDLHTFLRILHIASGTLALVFGSLAAWFTKGSKRHIKSGFGFYMSMMLCSVSALGITLAAFNPFLMGIALFSLYLLLSGKWAFKPQKTRKVVLAVAGILTGLAMLTSWWWLPKPNYVLLAFGAVLTGFTLQDVLQKKQNAVMQHGARMGGAFIAACTAFVVVNGSGVLPWYVLWFAPSVLGSVLISVGLRNWAMKGKSVN